MSKNKKKAKKKKSKRKNKKERKKKQSKHHLFDFGQLISTCLCVGVAGRRLATPSHKHGLCPPFGFQQPTKDLNPKDLKT